MMALPTDVEVGDVFKIEGIESWRIVNNGGGSLFLEYVDKEKEEVK